MGFADSLKLDILRIQEEVNDEVINTFVSFSNKAVDYSPTQVEQDHIPKYAKGTFANSWYVAFDEFDETIGSIADTSASGSKARINAIKGNKSFMFKDGYISLTNNLDYAYEVEFGWSTGAAPYAPLRQAIAWVQGVKKV